MSEKQYYTRNQIAKMLDVIPGTIYKWYKYEGLPIAFYVSNRPRFDLDEVTKWLKEKTEEKMNKGND